MTRLLPLLRVDVVVDPGHELGDVGVDSGQAGARAADSPADETDQRPATSLVECQRSAAVTLQKTDRELSPCRKQTASCQPAENIPRAVSLQKTDRAVSLSR